MSAVTGRRLLIGYAALMAALATVLAVWPALDSVVWAAIGLASAGAIVHGIMRYRPPRSGPWWALAAALIAMMVGDFIYGLISDAQSAGGPAAPPALAELAYLLMFPIVAVALVGLTRAGTFLDDRTRLLDLLALGSAALLAAWVFIASPRMADGMSAAEWSTQAAFTLGDVIVIVVTVRLVSAAPRNAAARLLSVGAAGMLLGDMAYGVAQADGGLHPGGPADFAYVLLYAAWGAAALHPSMTELTAPASGPVRPARESVHGLGLALLLACVAFAPLILLVQALTGGVHDGPMIAVTSGVTLVLLVVRLSDAVGKHASALRRERALRETGTVLVGARDAGQVAAAVKAAVATLLPDEAPHAILVDFSLTDLLPLGELSAPRIQPVGDIPPLWSAKLSEWDHVLVCPLDAGVLYVAGRRRDLLTAIDAVSVVAGQAALALARIGLTDAASRRDSDEYLRAVTEHGGDVVLVLDDDQRIRYTSPSVAEVLGIWPTPFATLREIVAPEDRDQVEHTVARARAEDRDGTRDTWSLRRPDGTRILLEVIFRDLRDDRLVRGMVVTLHDVTEDRRTEHELLRRAFNDKPAAQNRDSSARKFQ
ncbi:PAS domain-containing protein [Dactylosporangium sp. NPDC051541]|uniref:PAS domain-containing protein n=1 Tax=Dactylosporangium sp. NPDC051541 TaxID=3363977 RepID=UPI003797E3E7